MDNLPPLMQAYVRLLQSLVVKDHGAAIEHARELMKQANLVDDHRSYEVAFAGGVLSTYDSIGHNIYGDKK